MDFNFSPVHIVDHICAFIKNRLIKCWAKSSLHQSCRFAVYTYGQCCCSDPDKARCCSFVVNFDSIKLIPLQLLDKLVNKILYNILIIAHLK